MQRGDKFFRRLCRDEFSGLCFGQALGDGFAIANVVQLGAIVCYTATGSTVLRVTRERPGIPVIGLTPVEATARRLSLVWGVQSILTGDPENLSHMVRKACRIAFVNESGAPIAEEV